MALRPLRTPHSAGAKRRSKPHSKTSALQVQYILKVDDFTGAKNVVASAHVVSPVVGRVREREPRANMARVKSCPGCGERFQDFPRIRRTSNLLTWYSFSEASSLERLRPTEYELDSGCTRLALYTSNHAYNIIADLSSPLRKLSPAWALLWMGRSVIGFIVEKCLRGARGLAARALALPGQAPPADEALRI